MIAAEIGQIMGANMLIKRDFYINGAWVAPQTAHDCDVINPSTEEVCAVISLGSEDDLNAAVAAAKAAFPAWRDKLNAFASVRLCYDVCHLMNLLLVLFPS